MWGHCKAVIARAKKHQKCLCEKQEEDKMRRFAKKGNEWDERVQKRITMCVRDCHVKGEWLVCFNSTLSGICSMMFWYVFWLLWRRGKEKVRSIGKGTYLYTARNYPDGWGDFRGIFQRCLTAITRFILFPFSLASLVKSDFKCSQKNYFLRFSKRGEKWVSNYNKKFCVDEPKKEESQTFCIFILEFFITLPSLNLWRRCKFQSRWVMIAECEA